MILGIQIVRYIKNDNAGWGVLSARKVLDIDNGSSTLAEFLKDDPGQAKSVLQSNDAESYNLDDVQLASPVTKPSTITCQGANYSSHRQESGMTANALMSVSLDPKPIVISIGDKADMLEQIRNSGKFSVNILSCDQQEKSMRFTG